MISKELRDNPVGGTTLFRYTGIFYQYLVLVPSVFRSSHLIQPIASLMQPNAV